MYLLPYSYCLQEVGDQALLSNSYWNSAKRIHMKCWKIFLFLEQEFRNKKLSVSLILFVQDTVRTKFLFHVTETQMAS